MSRNELPALAQTAPPPSPIHFFWTGKMPSKKLQRHLLHWQHYLSRQNSQFRVCLWVTGDLHEEMRQHKNAKIDTDGDLTIGTPAIKIKNMDPLFAEAAVTYPELTEICQKLMNAKFYSFVSSFARMLILNAFPGFYCDTDIYPYLSPQTTFPESLDSLRTLYPQNNAHSVFCYDNGLYTENQIMLSLYANAFSEVLAKKNTDIIKHKKNPESPFSRVDALISAYQKSIDKIKAMLTSDPFLQSNAQWIVDFKEPKSHREKETHLFSTNQEKIAISHALSLFQLFYILSISTYDMDLSKKEFSRLYQTIQSCFYNPTQDRSTVYAWSHPIHFHLDNLRRSANRIGEAYLKRIAKHGGTKLFAEPRVIPLTADLNTLYKAAEEKDWHYALLLAQALLTPLSHSVITQIFSRFISENSPLPWQSAQLQFVNFLCDHCDTTDEATQEIISTIIKLALSRARDSENKKRVVAILKRYLSFAITSLSDLADMLTHLTHEERISLFHSLKDKLPDLFPFLTDIRRLFLHLNKPEQKTLSTLLSESLQSVNGSSSHSLSEDIDTYTATLNDAARRLSVDNIGSAKKLLICPDRLNARALNHIATLANHLSQPALVQLMLSPHRLTNEHFTAVVQKLKFSTLSDDLLERIASHSTTIEQFNFRFLMTDQPDFSAMHFFAETNLHHFITSTPIGDGSVLQQTKKGTDKTPISLAATKQQWETVAKIASLHHASPGDPECYCDALRHAAISRQWAICKTLIEQGAALTNHFQLHKIEGLHLIHFFIKVSQRELVTLTARKDPILLHCLTDDRRQLVEYAADNQRWEIVADIATMQPCSQNSSHTYGNVLLLAAHSKAWETCCTLIEQGAYLEGRVTSLIKQSYKPIHFFAEAGQLALLTMAIDAGANTKKRTAHNNTILELAANNGHYHILEAMEMRGLAFHHLEDPIAALRHDIVSALQTSQNTPTHRTRNRATTFFQHRMLRPDITATQLILLVRYASNAEHVQRHIIGARAQAINTAFPIQSDYTDRLNHCMTLIQNHHNARSQTVMSGISPVHTVRRIA